MQSLIPLSCPSLHYDNEYPLYPKIKEITRGIIFYFRGYGVSLLQYNVRGLRGINSDTGRSIMSLARIEPKTGIFGFMNISGVIMTV